MGLSLKGKVVNWLGLGVLSYLTLVYKSSIKAAFTAAFESSVSHFVSKEEPIDFLSGRSKQGETPIIFTSLFHPACLACLWQRGSFRSLTGFVFHCPAAYLIVLWWYSVASWWLENSHRNLIFYFLPPRSEVPYDFLHYPKICTNPLTLFVIIARASWKYVAGCSIQVDE